MRVTAIVMLTCALFFWVAISPQISSSPRQEIIYLQEPSVIPDWWDPSIRENLTITFSFTQDASYNLSISPIPFKLVDTYKYVIEAVEINGTTLISTSEGIYEILDGKLIPLWASGNMYSFFGIDSNGTYIAFTDFSGYSDTENLVFHLNYSREIIGYPQNVTAVRYISTTLAEHPAIAYIYNERPFILVKNNTWLNYSLPYDNVSGIAIRYNGTYYHVVIGYYNGTHTVIAHLSTRDFSSYDENETLYVVCSWEELVSLQLKFKTNAMFVQIKNSSGISYLIQNSTKEIYYLPLNPYMGSFLIRERYIDILYQQSGEIRDYMFFYTVKNNIIFERIENVSGLKTVFIQWNGILNGSIIPDGKYGVSVNSNFSAETYTALLVKVSTQKVTWMKYSSYINSPAVIGNVSTSQPSKIMWYILRDKPQVTIGRSTMDFMRYYMLHLEKYPWDEITMFGLDTENTLLYFTSPSFGEEWSSPTIVDSYVSSYGTATSRIGELFVVYIKNNYLWLYSKYRGTILKQVLPLKYTSVFDVVLYNDTLHMVLQNNSNIYYLQCNVYPFNVMNETFLEYNINITGGVFLRNSPRYFYAVDYPKIRVFDLYTNTSITVGSDTYAIKYAYLYENDSIVVYTGGRVLKSRIENVMNSDSYSIEREEILYGDAYMVDENYTLVIYGDNIQLLSRICEIKSTVDYIDHANLLLEERGLYGTPLEEGNYTYVLSAWGRNGQSTYKNSWIVLDKTPPNADIEIKGGKIGWTSLVEIVLYPYEQCDSVKLQYRVKGGDWVEVEMAEKRYGGSIEYSYQLERNISADILEFRIILTDLAGNVAILDNNGDPYEIQYVPYMPSIHLSSEDRIIAVIVSICVGMGVMAAYFHVSRKERELSLKLLKKIYIGVLIAFIVSFTGLLVATYSMQTGATLAYSAVLGTLGLALLFIILLLVIWETIHIQKVFTSMRLERKDLIITAAHIGGVVGVISLILIIGGYVEWFRYYILSDTYKIGYVEIPKMYLNIFGIITTSLILVVLSIYRNMILRLREYSTLGKQAVSEEYLAKEKQKMIKRLTSQLGFRLVIFVVLFGATLLSTTQLGNFMDVGVYIGIPFIGTIMIGYISLMIYEKVIHHEKTTALPERIILCPSCQQEIPVTSRYCPYCGAKIGIKYSPMERVICPHCGLDTVRGTYCIYCGKKLEF